MKTFDYYKLDEHDLKTVQVDGKRFYDVDGKLYPSVTTILSSMPKEGLDAWRARVGEEEANRIMRTAAKRGTNVHKVAEDYLKNDPAYTKGHMPDTLRMFNQIRPWMDDNVELVYGNEIALFSHRLKTAGRCDLIARVNGEIAIVDFKTSTNPKKAEWIENYFMQVTAYALAFYEMFGLVAKKGYILVTLEEENESELLPIKNKDYIDTTVNFFKQYHTNNS